ncbi:MAG: 3-oxoacyl-ACP reductase [Betaproteobacteria bacterium RIFCSPLOWO2_12_FULL_62_13]|nr:MAG: 3-oxoacyl-ACP reductase [Betaproteobacteria bacterium RIFCSPLOWO2_12_FULL_62_13]
MDLGIAGKLAIVTACSGGLGDAVARSLAAEGVHLALFARSEARLRANAVEIQRRYNVRVVPVVGDMRSRDDVENLVAIVEREFGGPDILVLNTGRPPLPTRDVLEETDDDRWEQAYRTQLWAAILVARRVTPLLVRRGWGRVIAITSASVKQPMPNHGLSTIFRAGVTGLMKHIANEVASKGVTVNTVCPASIVTDSLERTYDLSERVKHIPVGRLGRPEELAATVTFLASEYAGFITGTSIHVEGGMVASLL